MSFIRGASVALLAAALVTGCSVLPGGDRTEGGDRVFQSQEEGGVSFGGLFGRKTAGSGDADQGIGVNSYLWRASLDTLAFMPLASADPWGGVIITDWYVNPESPGERFKTTVYILDTRLRADALNVGVFKQVRDGSGGWVDSAVSSQTEIDLENAILTRARQLRLANVGG
ncbi:MAG TPA: DUF3576 domain-containing protein [Caulobacteraceae bacterium]|nr:DUF3576 domain-containing protein [Caulobacteraceae bacterium]